MASNEIDFKLKATDAGATDTLKKVSNASKDVKQSTESMTASVFKASAAWDTIKRGIKIVSDLMVSSIQDAAGASAQWAVIKTNINNAGLSYDQLAPKIQAYSEQAMKMAFDNEDAAQSLSRFVLVTKNFAQSQQLSNLAMDLARNKNITLEAATTSLLQVIQGQGAKALTQYGISFKDGASAAEVLNQLQGQLKGSTQAFADSAAGSLEKVNVQWGEMKKRLGEDLMPYVEKFLKTFKENLPEIKDDVDILAGTIINLAKEGKIAFEILTLGSTHWANAFTEGQDKANETAQTGVDQMNSMISAYNSLNKKHLDYVTSVDQVSQSELKLIAHTYNLKNKNTEVATSFDGVKGAAGSTASAFDTLKDKYATFSQNAITDLTDLAQQHIDKMRTISDSISGVKDQMDSLTKSYNQSKGSDQESIADQIVASETKIAGIREQLSNASTNTERQNLQKQLDEELKNFDSSAAFRTANAALISAAEDKAKETDLQRAIDSYTKKRTLADQEYKDKLATLNQELLDKQTEQAAEILLYTTKNQQIVELLAEANKTYVSASKERQSQTKTEVDAEISYFDKLAASILRTKSASSMTSLSITTGSSTGTPARATGGSVSALQPYVVGEQGQELFVPNANGTIIPNNKLGGGGITVNINGGTYLSHDVANEIGNMIVQNLRRVARV